MIDLEAYFSRIEYTGTRVPTLATLTEIHRHHARAIPFENLDVLLGRGIRIDPTSVEKKLIHDRRGGYCFEQNGLLRDVLTTLGFRVTPEITLRAGHRARQGFGRPGYDHTISASIVWWRRWL